MTDKTPAFERLAHAVATKHRARLARLAQITTQLGRVDAALKELRRPPQATEHSALQALGAHQAWAWRKEQHLLKIRAALETEAQKARSKAARTHGEERAAEQLLASARQAKKLAAAKKTERETPPQAGKPLWPKGRT